MNHPLHWPASWKRTALPTYSRFDRRLTLSAAVREVLHELELLGAIDRDPVISTNVAVRLDGLPRSGQAAPKDTGVALYYSLDGKSYVLACDAWDRVSHNLRAIARHIGALRGMDRWGVGTVGQAFSGYLAIEAPAAALVTRSCWDVLELDPPPWPGPVPVTAPEVIDAYKALAKERHPDTRAGSVALFKELGTARNEALEYLEGAAR